MPESFEQDPAGLPTGDTNVDPAAATVEVPVEEQVQPPQPGRKRDPDCAILKSPAKRLPPHEPPIRVPDYAE